ncbi:hypothetical protein HDIA_4784 [Hartmannibacter diazotrophicus]|uniref:Membrane-bound metallopeptidase n=1 Tax=Hartmannibacter diazotrophicus TaxID=1482074 RepID=A0A2C9DEE4_9HYPH|nr:hypothetical protein [Hartmannibacter diazotrophicus]SON58325.1 hypothetical protein HDIA_4784 [Hartmannibacter diazotrophicus]
MTRWTASIAVVAGLMLAGPALAQETQGAPAQTPMTATPSVVAPDQGAAADAGDGVEDLKLRVKAAESASMSLGERMVKIEAEARSGSDGLGDLKRRLEAQQDQLDRLAQDLDRYERTTTDRMKALEDRIAALEGAPEKAPPSGALPDMSQNNGPKMETPDRGSDEFPSDQELDRFFDFAHKAFRRFFGLVDDLKRDLNEERI